MLKEGEAGASGASDIALAQRNRGASAVALPFYTCLLRLLSPGQCPAIYWNYVCSTLAKPLALS